MITYRELSGNAISVVVYKKKINKFLGSNTIISLKIKISRPFDGRKKKNLS